MLKRRCGDGGNYGRAAPLTTTRERESPYLSRRVKLTAVHFLFVLPVWLNIISSDETTWTPFVWETMDRNNTQSLLGGADTDTDHYFHAPRYIILSFHRRKNLGRGEKARLNSRDKHFFFISPISLLISQKCIPLPLEEFSLKVIYTRDNRILFYFSSPKKSFVIFHSP